MAEPRPEDMALKVGAKALHEGRRFMYEEIKEYVRSFVDPVTGMLRAELLENRHCPVCETASYQPMFVKNGGTYVKCEKCAMCYLNPVFTDAALSSYYQHNHAAQAQVTSNEGGFYRSIYEKGLAAISKITRPGRLLDIGSSSGFFLDLALEKGWSTAGIELNRKEAELAKSKGHVVHTIPVEEAPLGGRFDAITLWDVFEHIKDGGKHLQFLKGLLSPGGVVFLQIPNSGALAARILHERCNMFDGIEHVNLYSPATIRAIAAKHGYAIEHLETVISEIPVVNNYLEYEDPYFGAAPHSSRVLGLIDEESLHRAHLGYKMQLVLKLA